MNGSVQVKSSAQESAFDSFCVLGYLGESLDTPRHFAWAVDCPYCLRKLSPASFDSRNVTQQYQGRRVEHCQCCGWWCFAETWDSCNTLHTNHFCGILQSFDLRSARVPLEVLELELPKWIEKIGHLNPQRMEDNRPHAFHRVGLRSQACGVHQRWWDRPTHLERRDSCSCSGQTACVPRPARTCLRYSRVSWCGAAFWISASHVRNNCRDIQQGSLGSCAFK